jgi:hypothetical protein
VLSKEQQDQPTELRTNTSGRSSSRRDGASQSQQQQHQQSSSATNSAIKSVPDSTVLETTHLPKGKYLAFQVIPGNNYSGRNIYSI